MKKLVVRSKHAFTPHFVLTVLGEHWSDDMMMLADCYRVPRLDAVRDLLGVEISPTVHHPIFAGVPLFRRPLPVL